MMDEPLLVSIVTPSYQQGRFLRQCIESVLTQDYPHIEYFVIDGGSTDESRSILESYKGRFFWKSEPDGGQTNAINSGLKMATGTILAYLNSDDILLQGAVSTIVQAWRDNPDVDVFYGRAHFTGEAGEVTGDYPTRRFSVPALKARCLICQPATFWQRRSMECFGTFDENFQTAMDYEYWQRIAAGDGRFMFIDQFLACSRDYATTKTRSQRAKVYKDAFKSQWLHWGHIHVQWWFELLNYLKNERRGPWRLLGMISPSKRRRISKFLSRHIRKKIP
jgi:glycosyltransferase involved in cell wall biosynthesis